VMSSIIEGYNYDIFISYRQKDNKYDGWVSEFVNNLKREIEATFKEEISVYFDINPHDGLLETHDVDGSLTEKLKCIVFIPVISRTYCDPKSFAWDHEFRAFVQHASNDRFGLKVKLPTGNVASRVLPVRIHDIDASDIRLVESLLGGVIRGVDFIYKEPGVNRPLKPEDDEKKNLTGAKYRNQINKTANAIKEIISGLNPDTAEPVNEKVFEKESWKEIETEIKKKGRSAADLFSRKPAKRLVSLLVIVLVVFGSFEVLKISQAGARKSIAVFYSPETKNDTTLKSICDIVTQNTHDNLKGLRNLTMTSRSTLLRYRDNEEFLNSVEKDYHIKFLLYGIVRRYGNDIKIWTELTSTKDNRELWSKEFSWDKNRISVNCTEIAKAVTRYLKIKLTPEEVNQMESEPTKNAEANLNYSIGNTMSYDAWISFNMANKYVESISFSSAIEAYDKAIEADPFFAEAYAKRAIARTWGLYTKQLDSAQISKCLGDISRASGINRDLVEIQYAWGFYYYYCKKIPEKALEYFARAAEMDPGDYSSLFYLAMVYRRMGDWNKSFSLMRKLIALDPQESLFLTNIGLTYTYFHDFDSALMYHQKAIEVMPAWISPYKNKIETLILKNGNTYESRVVLDTAVSRTGNSMKEFKVLLDIYDRRYAEALREAERSVQADFRSKGRRYLFLGRIYSLLGDPRNALASYDSAIVSLKNEMEGSMDDFELHSWLGVAYAGKGEKENAISEGKNAVELIRYNNLDKSDMILELAKIYTMVGEYEQAVLSIDYLFRTSPVVPSCFSGRVLKIDPVWEPLLKIPKYKSRLDKYLKS
jgi:tetratricopeptide (TPR) repeat protein